jgi:hypothetical protein
LHHIRAAYASIFSGRMPHRDFGDELSAALRKKILSDFLVAIPLCAVI